MMSEYDGSTEGQGLHAKRKAAPNLDALLKQQIQGKSHQQIAKIIAEALQSRSTPEPPLGKRFLRAKKVLDKVPWSRTTLWRKVRDGHFPAPVRLSNGVNAW